MTWIADIRQSIAQKGIRRTASAQASRVFRRTTQRNLARVFGQLGIPDGSLACIHSMLSGLGHLVDGPESIIRGLQDAARDCTVMAPTFPFGGAMLDYVECNPVYDRDRTPCCTGLLPRTLLAMPGARRGYHPTHPCVALGPRADTLITGTEMSETPFGDNSTYGRFSSAPNSVLLLLHTNNTSLVHRLQEQVDMPNLFLPDTFPVRGYDANRNLKTYAIRVHRPVLPLYALVEGDSAGTPEYVWFPDYLLPFPDFNRSRMKERFRNRRALDLIFSRHDEFVRQGIIRHSRFRDSELLALDVPQWSSRICADLRASLKQFADFYSLDALTQAQRNGLLTH